LGISPEIIDYFGKHSKKFWNPLEKIKGIWHTFPEKLRGFENFFIQTHNTWITSP